MSKRSHETRGRRDIFKVVIVAFIVSALGILHNHLVDSNSLLVLCNALAIAVSAVTGIVFTTKSIITSKRSVEKIWPIIFCLYFIVSLMGMAYIVVISGI